MFASIVKQLEIQIFIEFQKIRGRTGGIGCTVAAIPGSGNEKEASFRTGGKIINSSRSILSCRTGVDMDVPLPSAANLVEISNSQLTLGCAVEYENFVMLSMEGQKMIRFVPSYKKYEEL